MMRFIKTLWLMLLLAACKPDVTNIPTASATSLPPTRSAPIATVTSTPALLFQTHTPEALSILATATLESPNTVSQICGNDFQTRVGVILGTATHLGQNYLFIVNSDGTSFQWLTPGESPAWSPSGDYFIFQLADPSEKADNKYYSLYRMELDDRIPHELASPFVFIDNQYAWSANSQHIFFSGRRLEDDYFGLFSANSREFDWYEIRRGINGDIISPEMMPNGAIAASIVDPQVGTELFVKIQADGSKLETLLIAGDVLPLQPSYRQLYPDGETLLFVGSAKLPTRQVYALSLNDGITRELLDLGVIEFGVREFGGVSLAPNGELLTFAIHDSEKDQFSSELFLFSLADEQVKLLYTGDLNGVMWSSDNRHILFYQETPQNSERLITLDICNQDERLILELEGLRQIQWRP